jgi:hypothetical protein
MKESIFYVEGLNYNSNKIKEIMIELKPIWSSILDNREILSLIKTYLKYGK